jgi:hypothetical protein
MHFMYLGSAVPDNCRGETWEESTIQILRYRAAYCERTCSIRKVQESQFDVGEVTVQACNETLFSVSPAGCSYLLVEHILVVPDCNASRFTAATQRPHYDLNDCIDVKIFHIFFDASMVDSFWNHRTITL